MQFMEGTSEEKYSKLLKEIVTDYKKCQKWWWALFETEILAANMGITLP